MTELVRSTLAFIVVLGVLVTVHELGHYLVARWRGVTVEAFSLGFGPALVSRTDRRGTVWKISAIPLGGYVRMKGWSEYGAETDDGEDPGSFRSKSLATRAAVVAAGPAANFLLAFVLFSAVFATTGKPTVEPVVSAVLPHSAAAAAGLVPGDRILSVDGHAVSTFDRLRSLIAARPGDRVALTYRHDGTTRRTNVTTGTAKLDGTTIGQLGIEGKVIAMRYLPLPYAILAGADVTWRATVATFDGLWQLVAYHKGVSQLGGPIRIAQMSGAVAAKGVSDLVTFIGVLSINLGLINLIPIPILDGGHLMFYAGEALYGRALPRRLRLAGLQAGALILMFLVVFVTMHDLAHVGFFQLIANQFN